jgi:hypothetical protein
MGNGKEVEEREDQDRRGHRDWLYSLQEHVVSGALDIGFIEETSHVKQGGHYTMENETEIA